MSTDNSRKWANERVSEWASHDGINIPPLRNTRWKSWIKPVSSAADGTLPLMQRSKCVMRQHCSINSKITCRSRNRLTVTLQIAKASRVTSKRSTPRSLFKRKLCCKQIARVPVIYSASSVWTSKNLNNEEDRPSLIDLSATVMSGQARVDPSVFR